MTTKNRASLGYRIRDALKHSDRVALYLRRLTRGTWLRVTARDHVSSSRAVMRSDVCRSPEAAGGGCDHERRLALGRLQFDYLLGHGLMPDDRMLEIGCGNLQAGWRFIDYLEPGHYYGIDISPEILLAAEDTLLRHGLQDKLPHLTLVTDLKFAFLPDEHFSVVHAPSVFSHSPLEVIEECLAHVGRILRPDGFFDFTFGRAESAEHHVLREGSSSRTRTLIGLAERHGLTARFMADWEELSHTQSKIRVTRPGGPR